MGSDNGIVERKRKRISKREITDEEISIYLAKKAEKKAMKLAKKLNSKDSLLFSGYSNESNPFGDSNLNQKFIWKKKIKRDVDQLGVNTVLNNLSIQYEKQRRKERIAEIETIIADSKSYLKEFNSSHVKPVVDTDENVDVNDDSKSEWEDTKEEVEAHEVVEEEAGSFSPELFHCDDNVETIDPEEDKAKLELERVAFVQEQQRRIQEAMTSKKLTDNMESKAMKAMESMGEGGEVFGSGAEVMLNSDVYWWNDKYRPRKPKYFNRVHTGYEWNKYNRTHYDHDNPPPKFVQGYKFNIFYPDLVDKSKAPTYTIEDDGSSNGETCLIRFHAGPPYEDIAFRIVGKEWEKSLKKGFKATFDRGILQVYFNFKRFGYRR